MCKDKEMESEYARLYKSRQLWFWLGTIFICLSVILLVILGAATHRTIVFVEIVEINKHDLPKNILVVRIKSKDLATDRESDVNFLVELEEYKTIKTGGRYALIYDSCPNHDLRNIGIEQRLLKVYELK